MDGWMGLREMTIAGLIVGSILLEIPFNVKVIFSFVIYLKIF